MRKTFSTTIEESIQARFKQICDKNGYQMNEILETMMKAYIEGKIKYSRTLSLTSEDNKPEKPEMKECQNYI